MSIDSILNMVLAFLIIFDIFVGIMLTLAILRYRGFKRTQHFNPWLRKYKRWDVVQHGGNEYVLLKVNGLMASVVNISSAGWSTRSRLIANFPLTGTDYIRKATRAEIKILGRLYA